LVGGVGPDGKPVRPRGLAASRRALGSSALAEEWQTPYGSYGSYGSKALCYRSSFVDSMINNWSKWAEESGIDGYYIDNMVRMTTLTVPVERHNYRLVIIEKK